VRFLYLRDPLFLTCVATYFVNRLLLKQIWTSGFVHEHLNDLICIPFWVPIMLFVQRRLGLRPNDLSPRPGEIVIPLIVWSWVFEIILPQTEMFGDLCFADHLDVMYYALGALAAALFWRWWYRAPDMPLTEPRTPDMQCPFSALALEAMDRKPRSMFRVALVGAALVGCQGMPVLDTPGSSGPPPNVRHAIVLFEEIEADSEAVKQVVLRHVPPGTPLDRAQVLLEEQGFTCRPYTHFTACFDPQALTEGINLSQDARKHLGNQRKSPPLYCLTTRQELEEWHLSSQRILVVLVPDEAHQVQDVEVGLRSQRHPNTEFFKTRPGLHEPVGLPVEEARVRMAAAGFQCTAVEKEADNNARPHLLCEAFDEHALGGRIVRVYLYPDATGVIRETKVLDETGWFDAERCMLPNGDESPAWVVGKGELFPVRVGCRYTLITVGTLMVLTALGAYGYH